ncbi:MAG: copper-binding protein [Betaproteobacteria bacterium]|nr:copper-binding protein [Betaproteobacteria bacterium]
MKKITLAAALAAALIVPAYAQQKNNDHAAHHPAQATNNAAAMADGEVRRIDKDAKKLTLRHGPIKSLDMPPMTMVFQVKDAALLDRVNIGDKVKFNAEKIPGGYAVTEIEAVK